MGSGKRGTSKLAYVIGSEKGKKIAEEMKAGDTYKASDGSVWKKESDGTVTVETSGNTYKNAYTPEKTASKAPATSNYSPYSGGIDLGDQGKGQMAANAPWQDVLLTATNRYDKAINTPGLEQYADDELQREMMMYVQNKIAEENAAKENAPVSQGNSNRTAYNSKYSGKTDKLLEEILSRDDFSYDVAKDPMYKQYAKMYQREGDRAMRDTLAEVAMGAGGMNSYAVTAAQQAQNYYNSQLNDRIPELYQLAYDMYLADKESKIQDLGILQNMDATQYARYRDTMNDWENDRNYAYGVYQDYISRNDSNNRYNRETAQDDVWRFIELGVPPRADLITKSGMTPEEVDQLIKAVQNQQNTTGNNDAKYAQENAQDMLQFLLKEGYTPSADLIAAAGYNPESAQTWFGEGGGYGDDSYDVSELGIGDISDEELLTLIDGGFVILGADGSAKWANPLYAAAFITQYELNNRS